MSKKYSFEFSGTKEMFLNSLNQFPRDEQKIFHCEDYLIELSDGRIRFGISRGDHSGGYWFIPAVTELDDKVIFQGTVQYIYRYRPNTKLSKFLDKIEEFLLFIFFLPLIIVYKVCISCSRMIRKIRKLPIRKEKTTEDKLFDLMENHLNCVRR